VTIFESDKVGEKITKKVQDVCRQRLEDRVNEELALNLKLQQMKAAQMSP
jgi:energy-coupling factor transporter ATP-binding protein EcfA2